MRRVARCRSLLCVAASVACCLRLSHSFLPLVIGFACCVLTLCFLMRWNSPPFFGTLEWVESRGILAIFESWQESVQLVVIFRYRSCTISYLASTRGVVYCCHKEQAPTIVDLRDKSTTVSNNFEQSVALLLLLVWPASCCTVNTARQPRPA